MLETHRLNAGCHDTYSTRAERGADAAGRGAMFAGFASCSTTRRGGNRSNGLEVNDHIAPGASPVPERRLPINRTGAPSLSRANRRTGAGLAPPCYDRVPRLALSSRAERGADAARWGELFNGLSNRRRWEDCAAAGRIAPPSGELRSRWENCAVDGRLAQPLGELRTAGENCAAGGRIAPLLGELRTAGENCAAGGRIAPLLRELRSRWENCAPLGRIALRRGELRSRESICLASGRIAQPANNLVSGESICLRADQIA